MAMDWNKIFPPVEDEFLKHGYPSRLLPRKKPTHVKERKQARKRQKHARRMMVLHRKGR